MPKVLPMLLASVVIGGCAAQGARLAPPAPLTANEIAGVSAGGMAVDVHDEWWRALGDPQLDALVGEALAHSPTLESARAHLQSAEGALAVTRSARGAQLEADASVNRERLSETGLYPPPYGGATVNLGQVGVDLSYELDLFGRVRAEIRAGEAARAAAQFDLATARLGVASAVTRAYVALARGLALGTTLADVAARRRDALALTEQRVATGLDTSSDIEQARAAVAAADADVESNAESLALLRDELAALVGAGPGRGAMLAEPRVLFAVPVGIPDNLSANLLGRRADIAAGRARLESASAGVQAAEAAFFPDLNLSAMLGFQSIELGSLLSSHNLTWGVGPALSLPLFTAGRLRGALAVRDADYRDAVARYNDTVIGAYREVADAVASLRALEREQAVSAQALTALEHALTLAKVRYDAGLANYLSVLVAEDKLLAQRRIAVDLEARHADLTVALFRALGGGFAT